MNASSHHWYTYVCRWWWRWWWLRGSFLLLWVSKTRRTEAVDWSIGRVWDEHFVTAPTVTTHHSPFSPHTHHESALPDAHLHWHNIAWQEWILARCLSIAIDQRVRWWSIRDAGDRAPGKKLGWLFMHLNISNFFFSASHISPVYTSPLSFLTNA